MNCIKYLKFLFIVFVGIVYSNDIDPTKTVNPATGEMVMSIPLVNLDAGHGNNFPVNLGYKAGIQTYQKSSTAGLGFGIGTGSITRKVVMVPDDAVENTKKNHNEADEDGWIKFLNGLILVISIVIAIVCSIFGQVYAWSIVPGVISIFSSFIFGVAPIIISLVVMSENDFIAGGSHVLSFDYATYVGGTENGFFTEYNYNRSSLDRPDIYFLNTPYISGELVYKGKNGAREFEFIMKSGTGGEGVKVNYDKYDKTFEVVLKDGRKMLFKPSGKIHSFNNIIGSTRSKYADVFYESKIDASPVVGQWLLEQVRHPDESRPNIVEVIYETVATPEGKYFYHKSPTRQISEEAISINTTFFESFSFPKIIKTPNQKLEFIYSYDRLDNLIYVTDENWSVLKNFYGDYPAGDDPIVLPTLNLKPFLQPRLEKIKVLTKDQVLIKTIEFNTNYQLRPNSLDAIVDCNEYYKFDGNSLIKVFGNVPINEEKSSLTLQNIRIIPNSSNDQILETQFKYDNPNSELIHVQGRCPEGNNSVRNKFVKEERDLYGYYVKANSNTNEPNDFNSQGIDWKVANSNSWSLSEVLLASGKKIKWEYEPNRYDMVNTKSVASEGVKPKYGGGIRVKKIVVNDGMSHDYNLNFFYTEMTTPGVFTETNSNSSGHCTIEPYDYTRENDYRSEKCTRGGHYTASKVAYEQVTIVENYDEDASTQCPNGYTTYKLITSKEFKNDGVYGEIDKSWKRGRIDSVLIFDSEDNIKTVKAVEYEYKDLSRSVTYPAMMAKTDNNVIANGVVQLKEECLKQNGVIRKTSFEYASSDDKDYVINYVPITHEYRIEDKINFPAIDVFALKEFDDQEKADVIVHFDKYPERRRYQAFFIDIEFDSDELNCLRRVDIEYDIPTTVKDFLDQKLPGGWQSDITDIAKEGDDLVYGYKYRPSSWDPYEYLIYKQVNWRLTGNPETPIEFDDEVIIEGQINIPKYKTLICRIFNYYSIDGLGGVRSRECQSPYPYESFAYSQIYDESDGDKKKEFLYYQKEFEVSSDLDGIPNLITTITGDGQKIIKETIPAYKIDKYSKMKELNMLTQVYQVKVYKDSKSNANLLSSTVQTWKEETITILDDGTEKEVIRFLPHNKYEWKTDFDNHGIPKTPFVDFDIDNINENWILVGAIEKRDQMGNIVEYRDANDMFSTTIFDEDKMVPIAKFDNAQYGDCLFSSMEEKNTVLNSNFFKSVGTEIEFTADISHSGYKSLKIAKGSASDPFVATDYTSRIFLADEISDSKTIVWEFWAKADYSTSTYCYIQTLDANDNWHGKVHFDVTTDWKKYQFTATIPEGMEKQYRVVLRPPHSNGEGYLSGNIYYDDIRTYPIDAIVSSMTYDSRFNKVTSETNANGYTTYYEYDGFGRLKVIKNENKEIIKELEYHTMHVASKDYTPREIDSLTLINLYNSTDGVNWNIPGGFSNWDFDTPMDDWFGITLSDLGRVDSIILPGIRMKGELPRDIGNLTSLKQLDLNNNELSGEIPLSLYTISNLEKMILHHCKFEGTISTNIGQLEHLGELNLSNNPFLTGSVPEELGQCKHLYHLDLELTPFDGIFPHSINSSLRYLEVIKLGGCTFERFDGEHAQNFVDLSFLKLRYLALNNSSLQYWIRDKIEDECDKSENKVIWVEGPGGTLTKKLVAFEFIY